MMSRGCLPSMKRKWIKIWQVGGESLADMAEKFCWRADWRFRRENGPRPKIIFSGVFYNTKEL